MSEAEQASTSRRKVWSLIIAGVCAVIAAAGAALFFLSLAAPNVAEKVLGDAKVAVEHSVSEVVSGAVTVVTQEQSYPTIRLGPLGGIEELDWCNGEFIEMESYRMDDVPPVYAAHNNCGGDVILGWNIGDIVKVDGADTLYEVVDERITPKLWTEVAELRGVQGDFALQTCFYGENRMRFLGLKALSTTP